MFNDYCVPEQFQNDIGNVAAALIPFITDRRVAKMRQVLEQRTRQICAVFENTHHAHNISAVLRTMDAFGLLDVFFLYQEPIIKFRAYDAIDRGSSRWLMIKSFKTIHESVNVLKMNGYKIALVSRPDFSRSSLHYRADLKSFSTSQLDDADFLNTFQKNKIALIFGTELYGLSKEWIENADFYISVDMYGFCESLNVSVCAGIMFYALREILMKKKLLTTVSDYEKKLLFEHWIAKDTRHSYEYIKNQKPELMAWYLFVRDGNFYLHSSQHAEG